MKACRTPAEMPFVVAGQDHRGQVAASCPLWGPAPVQGGAERVGEVMLVVVMLVVLVTMVECSVCFASPMLPELLRHVRHPHVLTKM